MQAARSTVRPHVRMPIAPPIVGHLPTTGGAGRDRCAIACHPSPLGLQPPALGRGRQTGPRGTADGGFLDQHRTGRVGAAMAGVGHSPRSKPMGIAPGFSHFYTLVVTSGLPLALCAAASCGQDSSSIQSGYMLLLSLEHSGEGAIAPCHTYRKALSLGSSYS